MSVTQREPAKLNWMKSASAVLIGFAAIVVLSLGTDQVLHSLQIYPPWGQPMTSTPLLLLALGYRTIYAVLGCYLTARFAPSRPMLHAMILGAIGLVLSTLGAIGASQANLSPIWFPLALIATTLPCAWLGARLYQKQIEN